MPFQSGFAGEFEGFNRLELIQMVLRGLGSPVNTPDTDTAADYSRYPKVDIINKLNMAQVEFVRKTGALSTFAIVEAVADQAEYRWPRQCLKILEAKFYTGTTRYEELDIIPSKQMMKRISRTWKTDSAGVPGFLYPSYSYGNLRKFGIYQKPSSDGTTYSGTGYGTVTTAEDFTLSGSVTGIHNGGDGSASLIDTTQNFVELGVTVGMMIFNDTQSGKGQITAISTTTNPNDTLEVTLDSGDFDDDDSFEVPVQDYGVVIRADGSEEYVFSSEYGGLQDITPLSGNFLLDFVKRPFMLSVDTAYPEIIADYHQALIDYAVWKLGSSEYNGFVSEKKAEEGKVAWGEALIDYKSITEPAVQADNNVEDRNQYIYDD